MKASQLLKSTSIITASTLLSRILGFIRDMVIASIFGASRKLDGFFIAFRIPNLFRKLTAEGALTISFIPVYTDYIENQGEKKALELAQKTVTILLTFVLVIVALGVVFAPQLVNLFGWGFTDQEVLRLTVSLNRIMFPYLIAVSFVAFSMGVLNSHRYYFAPAFSPVFLNIGFIFGALIISNFFSEPLYGLAVGVLVGGFLQVILQLPYLIKTGYKFKISFDFKHPGIRKIFRLIGPSLFGIAIYHINILLNTILASLLPDGSISYLYYTDRLIELVLGVFIVSMGSVVFTEMSYESARNNLNKLGSIYEKATGAALFLSVPAASAMVVIGFPIISVLFLRGQFTVFDAEMTYKSLLCGSIGICSLSILRITTPTFYSIKSVKIPVITSFLALIINITLGYFLMQTSLRHAGLSLANSIACTIQMLINVFFLKKKIPDIRLTKVALSFFKALISSAVMAFVLYFLNKFNWKDEFFLVKLFHLFILISSGFITYFTIGYVLRVKEINMFLGIFRKKILRH